MKLKLETQAGATILCVTEDVNSQHAAILRAGLNKLFQSGKKTILLDLLPISGSTPEVLREISILESEAPSWGGTLIIICREEGIGQAKTREQAIEMMNSPLMNLLATEAVLKAKLGRLEGEKEALGTKMGASESDFANIKTLRRTNKDLKDRIQGIETRIQAIASARTDISPVESLDSKFDLLQRTLVAVLEQEGVLPVT